MNTITAATTDCPTRGCAGRLEHFRSHYQQGTGQRMRVFRCVVRPDIHRFFQVDGARLVKAPRHRWGYGHHFRDVQR